MAWLTHDNIITSLGSTTGENLKSIAKEQTGIKHHPQFSKLTPAPISLVNFDEVSTDMHGVFPGHKFTRFEAVLALSVYKTIQQSGIDVNSSKTLFILSTTKGNVELLKSGEKIPPDSLLYTSAKKLADLFEFRNRPVVVCNACISGVLAISLAKRYIDSGKYDTVLVAGADVVTEFVVAGFESFKSMSETPCKPFDKNRDGLSLGEGAGTIVVSNEPQEKGVKLVRGATANDANHISGPSRTGEGLYIAGKNALQNETAIDFISAHGTATPYNDDMESHAISRLGLENVPVNSFKGYFGHTLGAAGIIETILTKHSLLENRVYSCLGLQEKGVAKDINVTNKMLNVQLDTALKFASGFGGCNAAILLKKHG